MLTDREHEAALLIASGADRADLVARTGVSVSTVDKRIRALKTKLNAHNRTDLVIKCREVAQRPAGASGMTDGAFAYQDEASRQGGDRAASEPPADIEALFTDLLRRLTRFGVTHAVYSLIRRAPGGPIEHVASRWSFPPDVGFDKTIPPDENLAFRNAMRSWAPAPLDLEAMGGAAFYDLVPKAVRDQNTVFLRAGLVRGLTYALPGPCAEDRLVLSVLWQHASRERFERHVREDAGPIHLVLAAFRNAHLAMGRPRATLRPREAALLAHLAEGTSLAEAAEALGLSRRGVDRLLAGARQAYGTPTNTGAVAAYLRDRLSPALPF